MSEYKPILCLDFDGVLHSYTSKWVRADIIPDEPVAGMVPFLEEALKEFDVQIFSSRSNQPDGIAAMKQWLCTHIRRHFDCEFHHGSPKEFERATIMLESIKFPTEKPPALITIDDRAITFTGKWPKIKDLKNFKPWNRK